MMGKKRTDRVGCPWAITARIAENVHSRTHPRMLEPKLDKERSLGYVRRAKRRQYAGDEQTFRSNAHTHLQTK
eukprot:9414993-Pyramimonas_sp.AAC.3